MRLIRQGWLRNAGRALLLVIIILLVLSNTARAQSEVEEFEWMNDIKKALDEIDDELSEVSAKKLKDFYRLPPDEFGRVFIKEFDYAKKQTVLVSDLEKRFGAKIANTIRKAQKTIRQRAALLRRSLGSGWVKYLTLFIAFFFGNKLRRRSSGSRGVQDSYWR